MEVKQYNTYIFEYQKSGHRAPFKGKVTEITETTIKVENLDTGGSFRDKKDNFFNDWKAVEVIEDFQEMLDKAIKDMGIGQIQFQDFTTEKVPYHTLYSCNPENGDSGICGCTMTNEMVERLPQGIVTIIVGTNSYLP